MKNLQKILYITVVSLLLAAATQAKAQIIISEVDAYGSGTGSSAYNADWFELTNTGTSAVNITGWVMDDSHDSFSSGDALVLAGNSIAAGQTVVFIETTGTTLADITPKFEAAWFGSNVPAGFTIGGYSGGNVGLSQTSDAVNIYNASGVIQADVTFGASPSNHATFDNTAGVNGAISTTSAVGVNGAFESKTTNEIGSPGIDAAVVPEPSSYVLLLSGMLMLIAIQMRRREGAAGKI